jgi:prepilin-type N-terminal cleavage/methylation domain-containing protein
MRIDNVSSTIGRERRDRRASGAVSRAGFTLVELMVAMALSLFLMTILAEAFAVSMDTFRGLRAIGDMQDTLRTSFRQMRDDLSAPHFEGGRKLSDVQFWSEPRREGFFYVRGSTPTFEGNDGNGLPSTSALDHVLHFAVRRQGYRPENFFSVGPFAITANPPVPIITRYVPANNSPETFYGGVNTSTVPNPTSSLESQWAEVAYFLRPVSGTATATTPETVGTSNPVQLFNLYRAQLMILPYRDSATIPNITTATTTDPVNSSGSAYLSRISANGVSNLLSPNDNAIVTASQIVSSAGGQTSYKPANWQNRGFSNPATSPFLPAPVVNAGQISLVCTNVVSFQVRLLMQSRTTTPPSNDPNPNAEPVKSTVNLYDVQSKYFPLNPPDQNVWPGNTQQGIAIDSASLSAPQAWGVSNGNSPATRIMGLQIRLRIYDPASGQARQNTLVQGL